MSDYGPNFKAVRITHSNVINVNVLYFSARNIKRGCLDCILWCFILQSSQSRTSVDLSHFFEFFCNLSENTLLGGRNY